MLKTLLKSAGLLVILIGVVLLAIVVFAGTQTNTTLGLSLVLVVLGLISHIIINRMVE